MMESLPSLVSVSGFVSILVVVDVGCDVNMIQTPTP